MSRISQYTEMHPYLHIETMQKVALLRRGNNMQLCDK